MIYTGIVEWFSKGYGFISWEIDGVKQKDLFVHYSDISMDGYKNLKKEQKVEFCVGLNKKGAPKAIDVKPIF